MNINEYREDLKKQEKGSPCYFSDSENSSYIDVRRVGTPQYKKEIEYIKKSLYTFNEEPNWDLVQANWLAEYGVTGWDGIYDESDSLLQYSKQAAKKIFLNPEYFKTLNELLIQHGASYQNYLHDKAVEDAEVIKKN